MLRNLIFVCALLATPVASATEAGWALLRDGGHVVLLRHAYATGATDPANVDPENCATQRNLSERGRQQARKMGVHALMGDDRRGKRSGKDAGEDAGYARPKVGPRLAARNVNAQPVRRLSRRKAGVTGGDLVPGEAVPGSIRDFAQTVQRGERTPGFEEIGRRLC